MHCSISLFTSYVYLLHINVRAMYRPATWIMVHVGAPVPLAIMVIAWGAVSAGTSGINGTGTFYLVRFLLGLCEGGCAALLCLAGYAYTLPCCFTALVLLYCACVLLNQRVASDRTFPGAWHHLSTFFNTLELGVGYAAVASATALSQVPCSALTLCSAFCAPTCADSRQAMNVHQPVKQWPEP